MKIWLTILMGILLAAPSAWGQSNPQGPARLQAEIETLKESRKELEEQAAAAEGETEHETFQHHSWQC